MAVSFSNFEQPQRQAMLTRSPTTQGEEQRISKQVKFTRLLSSGLATKLLNI
jgi:hypothetical protein